jgi:hypothetical protein
MVVQTRWRPPSRAKPRSCFGVQGPTIRSSSQPQRSLPARGASWPRTASHRDTWTAIVRGVPRCAARQNCYPSPLSTLRRSTRPAPPHPTRRIRRGVAGCRDRSSDRRCRAPQPQQRDRVARRAMGMATRSPTGAPGRRSVPSEHEMEARSRGCTLHSSVPSGRSPCRVTIRTTARSWLSTDERPRWTSRCCSSRTCAARCGSD